jgi:hypothetical protein
VTRHRSAFSALSAVLIGAATISSAAQQAFSGRISDSTCGLSHAAKSSAAGQTDRQCLLACIDALAKYVLVDEAGHVVPIANQDAMGLPLYAGRPVKVTGDADGGAITVARLEAIAAHLHLLHVMTNWRDTPGARGFLPVAIDQARAAALHAGLAAKGSSLDDIKAQAGEALQALDPAIESRGADTSYGVRKAVAGALQHLEQAVKGEGATPNIITRAAAVSSSLADAQRLVDEAIAAAQGARAATERADAAARALQLAAITARLATGSLTDAQTQMNAMLEAEHLLGAPR